METIRKKKLLYFFSKKFFYLLNDPCIYIGSVWEILREKYICECIIMPLAWLCYLLEFLTEINSV